MAKGLRYTLIIFAGFIALGVWFYFFYVLSSDYADTSMELSMEISQFEIEPSLPEATPSIPGRIAREIEKQSLKDRDVFALEWISEELEALKENEKRISIDSDKSSPKDECFQLGVFQEGKNCNLYEQMLQSLKSAKIFYNNPTKMTVSETVEISLALNPANPSEAQAQLTDLTGTPTSGESKIARHMSAEITGANFVVEPPGLQKRLILENNTTTWKWKVTPLKKGKEELLTLDVYAHFEVNGETSPAIAIKTYREKILVEVTAWDSLKNTVSQWTPIIALLLTLIGAFWGLYRWVREKQWRAPSNETP